MGFDENIAKQWQAIGSKETLVPPWANYLGQSYSNWAANFWKYFFLIPASRHPRDDETGTNAYEENTGDVFFLCGTVEKPADDKKPTTRRVKIPPNKGIFIPLACCEMSEAEDFSLPEHLLLERGRKDIDQVNNMVLTINGTELDFDFLKNFRTESSLFELTIPVGGMSGLAPGKTRAVAVGYYVLLRSLPNPGDENKIRIYVRRMDYYVNDVTYVINQKDQKK
jgi:hypothetical protein